MTIGMSALWLKSIKDVDKAFAKCVEKVWPSVISRLSSTELEDNISQRLVDILGKEREVWNLGFIGLQHKLREEDISGDFTTKGIIDIVLFLDNSKQKYIAYECKRLNRIGSDGSRRGSLAGEYFDKGVMRYVTAQYAEKLPYGCMLGYVMDGDVEFALKQLNLALDNRKRNLNCNMAEIESFCDYFTEFETVHIRESSQTKILVRHRLLPIIS